MGSIGASNSSYVKEVNSLEAPKGSVIFSDSRVSPIKYDGSKVMTVNFGDWQKPENYMGIEEIPISKLVTTQPYVQSNKLLRFGKAVDTTEVAVLKIGDSYYVSDGNHRVVSNILAGKKKIRVKVYKEN